MRNQVRAVKLRRDRIAVVLDTKIYVYNFYDLKLRDKIQTAQNPKGLCCLSSDPNNLVLASPDLAKGHVLIKHYHQDTSCSLKVSSNALAALALNADGHLVAAACDKGTIIKLYDTELGNLLREFARGIDRAEIACISFHQNSSWLACSSDKGTIHVFSISERPNPRSVLNFMKPLLPKYFNAEFSFAQYRLKESRCICGFNGDCSLVILNTKDGGYHLVAFDPQTPGEARLLEQHNIFQVS